MQNNTPSSREVDGQGDHGGPRDTKKKCLVRSRKKTYPGGVEAALSEPAEKRYRLVSRLPSKHKESEETQSIFLAVLKDIKRKKQKGGFGQPQYRKDTVKHESKVDMVKTKCLVSTEVTSKNSSSTITEFQRNSLSGYSVGDTVKVIDDINRFKELQKCHGGWNKFMNLILKEKGSVKSIHPNGDLQVEIKDTRIRLNPECVVKVKSFLTDMRKSADFPLHVAVRNKDYRLCCQLIEDGADVNALNEEHLTPIMLAAQIGCEEVLSLLVQHPDARIDIGDQNKDTALHLALKHSNAKAAQILLEAGAYIKAVNNQQFTPFHLAAMYGQDKILEMCLDKHGESLVDLQKDDMFASIHLATLNNHSAYLRLLIGHNADLNIRNNQLQTALHIAVSQKYMDCVKILMESKAKVDLQDEDGNTPLHKAIHLQNIHKMKKMIARFELEDTFRFMGGLQRGCDKPKTIAIYLAEHGASLDTPNNDGKSPLNLCQDESLQKTLHKIQAKRCRVQEIPSPAEPDSQKEPTEHVQLAIQNVQNDILCLICQENRPNVAFNCGHRACSDCANNLNDCHLCRQRIETRIRIY